LKNNIYSNDLAFANSLDKELLDIYSKKLAKKYGPIISSFPETKRIPQQNGIDRHLFFRKEGKVVKKTVEEKIRRKFYKDFLFEFVSNDTEKVGSIKNIGWIKKDLICDFILFYFNQNKKDFLFNWKIFQKTYFLYANEWIEKAINQENGFRFVYAYNKRRTKDKLIEYKSHSLIVPANIFIDAYKNTYKKFNI